MTLSQICEKYSAKELQSMPGDAEFRYRIFSPILSNIFENKIVYYERFMCIAILEDIKITSESFYATAVPYLKIEREENSSMYYPQKPWKIGVKWSYLTLHHNHFGTYGGWSFWTDKVIVQKTEELARNREFDKAMELTLYKE